MITAEKVEKVLTMQDCEECFATDKTMIDVLHPVTGLTVCYGKTLEQVRAERPEYASAERMTVDEYCRRKAAAQDAATNARLGGRPSSTRTYTVREPGMSYWWQGTRLGEARKQLRVAQDRGLARARLYVTVAGETTATASSTPSPCR